VSENHARSSDRATPRKSSAHVASAEAKLRSRIEEALEEGVDVQLPTGGFDLLGGMCEAKEYLESALVAPLRHPQIAAEFGISSSARLLLWGPPGCGKTLFARAAAAEAGATLIAVRLSDILSSYIGEDERNLSRYFDVARSVTPCVILFDEADSFAARRNAPGMWEIERRLTNAFLQELDGGKDDNEGVAVVLSTNQPWLLDPAARRAGRVDSMLYVGLPDDVAREAIWRVSLETTPCAPNVDVIELARLSPGLTGAEIVEVSRRAIRAAFMHSVDRGEPIAVGQLDLLHALAATPVRSADWFSGVDKAFCYGHTRVTDDLAAVRSFYKPEHQALIVDAIDAHVEKVTAEW
jgi:SpoVK/Ycf46/Vps4 family AAA+-type ATPase